MGWGSRHDGLDSQNTGLREIKSLGEGIAGKTHEQESILM